MGNYDPYASTSGGGRVFGWACRQLVIWGALVTGVYLAVGYGAQSLRQSAPKAPDGVAQRETAPARVSVAPAQPDATTVLRGNAVTSTLTYRADRLGHFWIDAVVNGAPVKFVLDTGASFVALTRSDAAAAGFANYQLDYTRRSNTANGQARVAPVRLREIRLGQLTVDDVQAVVMEKLDVSLLGNSFLKRMQSYEMRDGLLTITW